MTNKPNRRYSSVDTGGVPSDVGRPSQGGQAISTVTAVPALRRDGEEITDHDLVARVRTGDDRAFEKLYTRYNRRIASYVQGMVHDHARAEDITQDVFMSALRRMRETDRPIAFKPWVYEIAKNACIDQFRRSRRAEEVSMDADEGLGSADYGRLVSSGPTPDVAVDHKEQLDHLCGAFGGLSETHHEILVMRELEGLSYREIGDKLGMTRPAVESTLFRARRRLTEEYDQLVTGERCVRVQSIIASAGGSALGARDKRRVARHVSYCQPCMRQARMSGIDAKDLVHKPVRAKIAALLPLPAFLKERWGAPAADPTASTSLAQWSLQASSIDPGLVSTWGKAAATAATIAIAGVSAGVATDPSKRVPGDLGRTAVSVLSGDTGGSSDDGAADRRAGGSSGGAAPARAGSAPISKGSKAGGGAATSRRGGTATTSAGASAPSGTATTGGGDSTANAAVPETPAGDAAPSGDTDGLLSRLGGSGEGDSGDDAPKSSQPSSSGPPAVGAPSGVELPKVDATAGGGGSGGEAPSDGGGEDPVQGILDRAGSIVGGG